MAPNSNEPPSDPRPRAAVTFSLAPQSSFSYCPRCDKPIVTVGKRKESHECNEATSASSSRRSSAVAGWLPTAVFEFLFGEKEKKIDNVPERMRPHRVDTISLRRTMTYSPDKAPSHAANYENLTGNQHSIPPVSVGRMLRNSVS